MDVIGRIFMCAAAVLIVLIVADVVTRLTEKRRARNAAEPPTPKSERLMETWTITMKDGEEITCQGEANLDVRVVNGFIWVWDNKDLLVGMYAVDEVRSVIIGDPVPAAESEAAA